MEDWVWMIGIGSLITLLILIWTLASCFCSRKEEEEQDLESQNKPNLINKSMLIPEKEDVFWDDSSSYGYQANKYGLDDPFGEWKPKGVALQVPQSHIPPVYPKSPLLRHKPLS